MRDTRGPFRAVVADQFSIGRPGATNNFRFQAVTARTLAYAAIDITKGVNGEGSSSQELATKVCTAYTKR